MASVYVLISPGIIYLVFFFMVVTGNSQSHWCPSTEMRRVSCLQNVSKDGRPPVLRQVYQWKKEMVLRCCPGFMGPNCEKACFSCQQWAEMSGRIHHLERHLTQIPPSRGAGEFQPFRVDLTATHVCWTKDGRPVYGHVYGQGNGEERRGSSSGGRKMIERNRVVGGGGGGGVGEANSNAGCPIYSRRNAGERGNVMTPYSVQEQKHMQQQRLQRQQQQQQQQRLQKQQQQQQQQRLQRQQQQQQQQQQRLQRQQQQQQQQHQRRPLQRPQPVALTPDSQRAMKDKRQESLSRDARYESRPSQAAYQRHSSILANQKGFDEDTSGFKAAEMVVSLESSLPSSKSSLSSIKRNRKSQSQNGHETRKEYGNEHNDETGNEESELDLQYRLSVLERHVVELESKMGPALSSVSSLKEELSRLTETITSVHTSLETAGKREKSEFGRKHEGIPSGQTKRPDARTRFRLKRKWQNTLKDRYGNKWGIRKHVTLDPTNGSFKYPTPKIEGEYYVDPMTSSRGDTDDHQQSLTSEDQTRMRRTNVEGNGGETSTESKAEGGENGSRDYEEDRDTYEDKERGQSQSNDTDGDREPSQDINQPKTNPNRNDKTSSRINHSQTVDPSSKPDHPNQNPDLDPTSTSNQTSANRIQSSLPCHPSCNVRPSISPPPLPDKEMVQAVFSSPSPVMAALGKGHREFYQELKKTLRHQDKKHGFGGYDVDTNAGTNPESQSLIQNDDRNKNTIYSGNGHNQHERDKFSASKNIAPTSWSLSNVASCLLLVSSVCLPRV